MDFVNENAPPGTNLCDMLPWMVYLPSWLSFQRRGKHGGRLFDLLRDHPFEHVKRQMDAGTALPSITQQLLQESQGAMTAEWESAIRGCAGSMYGAGTETTYASTLVFILAMLLHPKVQAKAQAELDSVVGSDRLPSVSDREDLPYVSAVIKEVLRWHPVAPLGLPRCLGEEDIYGGYRLPKGTVLLPNAWALSREPNLKYPPEEFLPERFLDANQSTADPSTYIFGFGRRVCPGKLLAESIIFAMVTHLLTLFTIERAPGSPVAPSFRSSGLSSPPLPFVCAFKPRRSVYQE